MPVIRDLVHDITSADIIFPQCTCGSGFQKLTKVLVPMRARIAAERFLASTCVCESHADLAIGVQSAKSGEYPSAMCLAFIHVCEDAAA